MQPINIFIATYLRQEFTRKCIQYLKERTKYPYKLWILDNGGNEEFKTQVDHYVGFKENIGIHGLWNTALALTDSELFITTDNDLLVPDLDPDWLTQLVGIMDKNPEYGAVSLHPHIFIGAANVDSLTSADLVERNMCGAVFRVMRRSSVWQAGGWENKIEAGRNHEERWICSRLQSNGYKTGIAPKLRAYHMFGDNWGYPESFTPEMQKHNPDLKEYVKQFDQIEGYNPKTWFPK